MHQKPPQQGSNWGQRKTIKMLVTVARGPKGKLVTKIMMQPEAIKVRPGGMIKTKSNAITARVGGICDMSAPVPEMQDLQTPGGGTTAGPPPEPKQNTEPVPAPEPTPNQQRLSLVPNIRSWMPK